MNLKVLHLVKTENVGNELIDIELDDFGHFSASFDDQTYMSKTMGDLLEQLKKAVKHAVQRGV